MKTDLNLLTRFYKCETTPEEEDAVLDWLDADPAHQKEMDDLDFVLSAGVLHNGDQKVAGKRRPAWRSVFTAAASVAAAVAIFMIGGRVYEEKERNRMAEVMTGIDVPAGQRIMLTLQDGSRVWLNSGSHLEYPAVFAKDGRTVSLSGEAMFEVVHDEQSPFTVVTPMANVRVLGTRFNVVADEVTGIFETSLLSGRLHVFNVNESVDLKSGDMVSLLDGHLTLGRIESQDEYLWTDGIISLQNSTFEELLAKFEKAFGVRFVMQSETSPTIRCRGKVRISDGVEHALRTLQLGGTDFTFEYNRTSDEIYIR